MKKYNTIINYIEPTKILQRVTVDTFNNTYPLGHEYSGFEEYVSYEQYPEASADNAPEINAPSNLYYKIYDFKDTIDVKAVKIKTGVLYTGSADWSTAAVPTTTTVYINNVQVFQKTMDYFDIADNGTTVYQIDCSNYEEGTSIKIECVGFAESTTSASYSKTTVTWGGSNTTAIIITKSISPVPRIQLNAVCKRIFEGSLGRREDDPVRFHLDSATEQWFSQITAPEYSFTRSTLYDVLMEIGGTKEVNAVPRLLWNEQTNAFDTITFVKQGDDTDEYTLPSGVKLTGEEVDISAGEYCEEFDSYAENIVNTLDAQRGSIIEPCMGSLSSPSYKAPTSEEIVITDNSAIIGTLKPIYRILQLRVKVNNSTADITPYVFEAAEYDNLTSYSGTYPYAKEWALRYAQGDNKITGLCLKAEQVYDLQDAFTEMAIVNIVRRVLGIDYSSGICNLSFSITYIPFYTARVKQRKPTKDWKGSGTATYNQGSNVVEADYYGNHLKNYLAKIGNPVKKYTFRLQGEEQAPRIGQVFYDEEDGELLYISQVDEEIGLTYTLVTMWCTRNVNRLYNYISMNSRRRQYAIDEKMSVDRHINISENIYIGDNVNESDSSLASISGISMFMAEFKSSNTSPITVAIARGMTGNSYVGESAVALPVTCAAFGNSIYFGFRFADNYSAGNQAVTASGLGSAKRLVRAVPYGDDNGMFDYLAVALSTGKNVDAYQCPEYDNNPISGLILFTQYGDSMHGRIPIYKDSRDIINVNIQEHFIATRKTIIIGSELAFCNTLVRGESEPFGIAFLPYRLNVQRESLDIQSGYIAGTMADSDVTINSRKATIRAYTNTTGKAAKSWAIYNKANNRLVIGENMDIAAGGLSSSLVFNF